MKENDPEGSDRGRLAFGQGLLIEVGDRICDPHTTPGDRGRATEALERLLSLSRDNGFAYADVLREKLVSGVRTKRTYLLAHAALEGVPESVARAIADETGN